MKLKISGLLFLIALTGDLEADALDSLVDSKRTVVLYENDGAQLICGGILVEYPPLLVDENEVVSFSIDFDSVFSNAGRKIFRVSEINSEFIKKASSYFRDDLVGMANPTENFNSLDIIRFASAPTRRLIFAGESGRYKLIYFEQGGRAYSKIFYLTKRASHEFKDMVFSNIRSLDQLKKYFKAKYQ